MALVNSAVGEYLADGAAGSPAKRWLHSAVYDIASNRMTVLGVRLSLERLIELFQRRLGLVNANGLGGSPTWTKLGTAGLKPVHAAATPLFMTPATTA